jgi:alkylation response protein AidB-like acyl-CoA dehydrogenase
VEIIDDWDGFGQSLTASGTAVFSDVAIAQELVFPGQTRFRYSVGFFQLVHLATLAGIGRAAATDVADLLRARSRVYSHGNANRAGDDPQLLQIVGQVRGAAYAAGAIVHKAAEALHRAYETRDAAPEEHEAALALSSLEVSQSVTAVTDLILNATTRLFDALGASATKRAHGLDRHWRNARTIASHNPRVYHDRGVGDFAVNGAAPVAQYRVGQPQPPDSASDAGVKAAE